MDLFRRFFMLLLLCSICLAAANTREGRITGGKEARPHSKPYVVSLQSRYWWRRYRLCTGSILSERWILSAGHCVMDSWAKWLPMDAIVGAHNLEKISSSMIYPISHRIAHPMYRGGVGPYDIAMMKTSRDIEFSDTVHPIRLPTIPRSPAYKNTDNLVITGWGALQSTFFVTTLPNKLQEANVTYLPYYDCYRAVDKIKDYYEPNPLKRIHNLCTGPISGGIAGCEGDSGGPLVQYVVRSPQAEEEETTTALTSSSSSPIPMTTDRTSTTTTESTTMTAGNTNSPIPMTTDRTTTTSGSTMSPIPMTTDRITTTTESTMSPIPMTTDRTTTTSESTMSPIPMTTDRTTTTSESTMSPIPMTTDRTTVTTSGSTNSLIPMTTDRSTTITLGSTTTESTMSSTAMSTDISITAGTTAETTSSGPTTAIVSMTTSETNTTALRKIWYSRSLNGGYAKNRRVNNLPVFRVDFMPVVVGVMSWGVVPCGKRGAPTVYSNVSNYMDFINKYLHSN